MQVQDTHVLVALVHMDTQVLEDKKEAREKTDSEVRVQKHEEGLVLLGYKV